MRDFAALYAALDQTTKTSEKLAALRGYFEAADPPDAAWGVYFLSGRRPKRAVRSTLLRAWACELAAVPQWLFDESYHTVGDLSETIALLLPAPEVSTREELPLSRWVEQRLLPLRSMEESAQRDVVLDAWRTLDADERFVWNKLLLGGFRVGVSARSVTKALAEVAGLDPSVIAHRLMGHWEPTGDFYRELIDPDGSSSEQSRPYPFCLAYALEEEPDSLGGVAQWQAEWKWDGIRAQLIRRRGETFLWTRGEELVTERYPEIADAATRLPEGTVLDAEILPWKEGRVLPFSQLQRRIGRKTIGAKLLREVPVCLLAYDLLEAEGNDLRAEPLEDRRRRLEGLIRPLEDPTLLLAELVEADSWQGLAARRAESRDRHVEGLMLKRRDSPYEVGRVRGSWWKWKIAPLTVDAVLIYAQAGHGKRANLFSDYTFGVWQEGELIPIAKAYSGLTDEEIRLVDRFIRRNTLERFGPVRTVKAELVFELGFEGIAPSTRHKSGIATRFPRMLRWRTDKRPKDADTLDRVKAMIPAHR